MKNIPPPPSIHSPSLPLVTVVTVTYNLVKAGRGEMFRQCVASVQNQDYPAIEHLIMDGGSADGTLDLIREYEQQGVVRCYSEPDKGIYDAMNKGIARARGKYIAFLNSDDFWHDPGGIRQSVKLLELTKADFSYARCQIVKEDGSYYGMRNALISSFVCETPFCHQAMFVRTELLQQIGGFDDSLKIAADYACEIQLLLMGAKPVYVPHCFTSFRAGGISWDLSVVYKEVEAIHRHFYGAIVGNDKAADIRHGKVPVQLFRFLLDCVHPTVAREMQEYYVGLGAWFHLEKDKRRSMKNALGEKGEALMDITGRIAAIFPYSVHQRDGERCVLFCGLTLYVDKLQSKGPSSFKRKKLLFGWLPLFKEKVAGRRKKGYLLGFIPLYTALIE